MTVKLDGAVSDGSEKHHDLLGGWRNVIDDVRRLGSQLRRSSGVCACGHTASEAGGKCPCCHTGSPRTDCADCGAQVDALALTIDRLIDDTLRCMPALADVLGGRAATEAAEHLTLVRRQISVVDGAFRRLSTVSAASRRGCTASHLSTAAAVADELLHETWTLEAMLEPNAKRWAELRGRPSAGGKP